eukprot:Nitzschia sp. Nitz4//scaffold55_size114948//68278//68958//NITZ4_003906-RA/size114948-processed-gene-0.46-mRNA-1//1//CDS//3329554545//5603//frame0
MNQCIAVCQFNNQKGAYDVVSVESAQMNHVFGLAAHEMSEIFGETYELQRSPQVLTCSGNFDDMDDEEDDNEDYCEDDDDDGETMENLVDPSDEDYEKDEEEEEERDDELDQVDSSDDWEIVPEDEVDDSPPDTFQASSILSPPSSSDEDADKPTDDAFPFDDLDPLFSFECEKDRFVVARILTPIFVVGRKDPEAAELHWLLSPEEGARVIPILQERLGDAIEED